MYHSLFSLRIFFQLFPFVFVRRHLVDRTIHCQGLQRLLRRNHLLAKRNQLRLALLLLQGLISNSLVSVDCTTYCFTLCCSFLLSYYFFYFGRSYTGKHSLFHYYSNYKYWMSLYLILIFFCKYSTIFVQQEAEDRWSISWSKHRAIKWCHCCQRG